MYQSFKLNGEVTVLFREQGHGSELLLYQRDAGLVCRLRVRERGAALIQRLSSASERMNSALDLQKVLSDSQAV
jgi:hypothetical protein